MRQSHLTIRQFPLTGINVVDRTWGIVQFFAVFAGGLFSKESPTRQWLEGLGGVNGNASSPNASSPNASNINPLSSEMIRNSETHVSCNMYLFT
jgi:hypothetical protein